MIDNWQIPEEFQNRMKELLGKEYDAFLDALMNDKVQALRINTQKINLTDGKDRLTNAGFHLTQVPWEETGFQYQGDTDQPGKHPYHEAGLYYIQEPSAMAPVHFLEAQPGEKILDLCAAPGGKSTQIASAMQGEGILVSNEINGQRAKILSLNIERLGIRNCMVTSMSPQQLAERFEGYFDRILVDAPCSGEGMLRKSQEARNEWSMENIRLCAERQKEILDCAERMLAADGRIVYSTCTFAPEEDEESISGFLERHPDFTLKQIAPEYGMVSGKIPGTIRLFPHKLQGEGHFLAVMERGSFAENGAAAADENDNSRYRSNYCPNGLQKGIPEKSCKPWLEFRKQFLKEDVNLDGIFFLYGEQLYLAPEGMPNTDHLKCLRPGLHLGTIKKDRFEPSHALALALRPEDVLFTLNLNAEDPQLKGYLNGQTISMGSADLTLQQESGFTTGNGWNLICVNGISLGWGKLAGHVMKNHYPKGLRINY